LINPQLPDRKRDQGPRGLPPATASCCRRFHRRTGNQQVLLHQRKGGWYGCTMAGQPISQEAVSQGLDWLV